MDTDRAVSLQQSTVSGRQSGGLYQDLFRSFGGPSITPGPSTVSTAISPSVPRRLPQDFNGYDPQGRLHHLTKQPTIVSEDGSTANTANTKPVAVGKSGWMKPVSAAQIPKEQALVTLLIVFPIETPQDPDGASGIPPQKRISTQAP